MTQVSERLRKVKCWRFFRLPVVIVHFHVRYTANSHVCRFHFDGFRATVDFLTNESLKEQRKKEQREKEEKKEENIKKRKKKKKRKRIKIITRRTGMDTDTYQCQTNQIDTLLSPPLLNLVQTKVQSTYVQVEEIRDSETLGRLYKDEIGSVFIG